MAKPKHPYAQLVPALNDDQYKALKADIKENGVTVPVIRDEAGEIIDGHHRAKACRELKLPEPPYETRHVEGAEARSMARRLNIHRRHLTQTDRRNLIKAELADVPEKSDRQIAAATGASHPTVAKVRAEGEASGDVESSSTREDSAGRKQPAKKPKKDSARTGEPPAPVSPKAGSSPDDAGSAPAEGADTRGASLDFDAEANAAAEEVRADLRANGVEPDGSPSDATDSPEGGAGEASDAIARCPACGQVLP